MKIDENLKPWIIRTSAAIALFTIFTCIHTVPAGYIGVETTFGHVSEKSLPSGFYVLNPLCSVHDINARVNTIETTSEAASSDLQSVSTAITLNYNLNALNMANIYKTLGSDQHFIAKTIISPAVNEAFKSVVANYSAQDLIDKRTEVSSDINKLLQQKLNEYNINVDSINITDFKFSHSFNEAIEAKVTAQQQVLTAQNTLDKAKIEAQQKIVKAQAEAQSLSLQKEQITPELIQLREVQNESAAIEKWNGVLPTYTGNSMPFIMNNKENSK
jgi:regulator of protease activity HflC (stomatin/prohibitin superfamily)